MTVRGVVGAVGLLAAAGCTIQPRADTRGPEGSEAGRAPTEESRSAPAAVDEVLAAFGEALAVGDAARVATLGAPELTLVDQEEGVFWSSSDPASPLPGRLGSDDPSGLDWTLVDQRVAPVGDGRLVVRRYRAGIAGEAVGWWAVETIVLVPDDGRWKVLHLHRSRGPEGGETP